jgi:predicted GNAT superfamily acetyltransferase
MEPVLIRELISISDQNLGLDLFDAIWPIPGGGREIPENLMQAFVHNGSYFVGAFSGNEILGATFGFIGINGGTHLHSHMAAVLPKSRDLGVGALMKQHQYSWAQERKIPFISWTFDPLVRRNARFNISKLGVEISDYFQDFYGPMTDLVNAGDHSDRLMVKWNVLDLTPQSSKNFSELPNGAINIEIPEDIVALRAKNHEAAMAERLRVRAEFLSAFDKGFKVIGFSNSYGYILSELDHVEGKNN